MTTESEDQVYFRAIEDVFVRLRGAPLLLSPADWRVAQGWHRAGVPLAVVTEALETVFRQRAEREAKGRVQSLRYCRDAVESAWEEIRTLTEPARREAPAELDVAARLSELADALPASDLVARLDLPARVRALEGSARAVEEQLQGLEGELFTALGAELADDDRSDLDERVDAVLAEVREPLDVAARAAAAERLRRQILRRRAELPYLSLFV